MRRIVGKFQRRLVILDCRIRLSQFGKQVATDQVELRIFRFERDCSRVVIDGLLVITRFVQ